MAGERSLLAVEKNKFKIYFEFKLAIRTRKNHKKNQKQKIIL
jgi:hypothetical protein